jgi:general secretion pathway protein G
MSNRYLAIVLACTTLELGLSGCGIDRIPKKDETITAIDETSVRIGIYYQQNAHLPESLSDLPKRNGYVNKLTDAWDRPLIYKVAGNEFTLSSLGKDGAIGGEGEDADLVRRYKIVGGVVKEMN